MGINVNCCNCSFEGKQCFSYRRELLDALRAYLKENKKNHEMELKYINWFYRYEEDDEERVEDITEEEKESARKLLREKKLHGLFYWIDLTEESYISYTEARAFLVAYVIIKDFMKERCLDVDILQHAAFKKHNLQCW